MVIKLFDFHTFDYSAYTDHGCLEAFDFVAGNYAPCAILL